MRIEINLENVEESKEENPISEESIVGLTSYREQKLTITIEDYEYMMPRYLTQVANGINKVYYHLQKEWEAEDSL